MALRNAKGEAVMLAVMGIMMVGGLIFWMFSGHSHMSWMHGGGHPASEVRDGERHGSAHDAPERHPGEEREGSLERDRLRAPGGDQRNP